MGHSGASEKLDGQQGRMAWPNASAMDNEKQAQDTFGSQEDADAKPFPVCFQKSRLLKIPLIDLFCPIGFSGIL